MAKRLILALMSLLFFSLGACSKPPPSASENSRAQDLQQALDSSRAAGKLIGVSATIIDLDGKVWNGVSGSSHPGQLITEDMLFDTRNMKCEVRKNSYLSIVALFALLASCGQLTTSHNPDLEERISRVENGLLFTQSITDRMEHHTALK
jgi:hypothetical protein